MERIRNEALTLHNCIEICKTEQLSLEGFICGRGEYLDRLLADAAHDYMHIVEMLRGAMTDLLLQLTTLFVTAADRMKIARFVAHRIFTLSCAARRAATTASWTRSELAAAWHATVLADTALRPYGASFLCLVEPVLVERGRGLILDQLDDRLSRIEMSPSTMEQPSPEQLPAVLDLNTTAALNVVIDAINQVRLCPKSASLSSIVRLHIDQHHQLNGAIKTWASKQWP